jgi:predicted nucleotidyltransferase
LRPAELNAPPTTEPVAFRRCRTDAQAAPSGHAHRQEERDVSASGENATLRAVLDGIERDHDARVLYACAGGRGAWGLPPPENVREIRCVYVHPTAWYLSVDGHRRTDQVDPPARDGIQVHGWDLRRTLAAFHAGNAPLFEWLVSPVVHREVGSLAGRLRELRPRYFAPRASLYHYLHQARRAYRRFLRDASAGPRRYTEALVDVLALRWIEAGHGVLPGSFAELAARTVADPDLRQAIVERDPDVTDDDPRLDDLLDRELERFARIPDVDPRPEPGWDEIDDLFRVVLEERHAEHRAAE